MTAIKDIKKRLFEEKPTNVLYHYTSLEGLQGMISDKAIRASEIRYLNDAAEMRHTVDVFIVEIQQRLEESRGNQKLLTQLKNWLTDRLVGGHMLFVASFTEKGNLLSQWRGYCAVGKGISLGFNPDYIARCAVPQLFEFGKCLYDYDKQKEIAIEVIEGIETLGTEQVENNNASKRHPSQSFYDVFESCEDDLLSIAALLKHSSFQEEEEWRAISPIVKNYVNTPVLYREGKSMLVPYINFHLTYNLNKNINIQHIYLGPTPNINLSMKSLAMYLSKSGVNPRNGVRYSGIPYRSW